MHGSFQLAVKERCESSRSSRLVQLVQDILVVLVEKKSSEERMVKQRLSSDALAALIAHLRSNAFGIIRGPQQHCTYQRRATDCTALLLQWSFEMLECST